MSKQNVEIDVGDIQLVYEEDTGKYTADYEHELGALRCFVVPSRDRWDKARVSVEFTPKGAGGVTWFHSLAVTFGTWNVETTEVANELLKDYIEKHGKEQDNGF